MESRPTIHSSMDKDTVSVLVKPMTTDRLFLLPQYVFSLLLIPDDALFGSTEKAQSEAYPVLAYTLAPSVKYLVAVSNDRQGTCVDIDALSLDPAIIDFSSGQGQGNTTAIVTVDSSNNFTVKYSA